jgi:hypothetical protein
MVLHELTFDELVKVGVDLLSDRRERGLGFPLFRSTRMPSRQVVEKGTLQARAIPSWPPLAIT